MMKLAAVFVALIAAPLANAEGLAGAYVGGYIGGGSGDAHWDIAGGSKLDHSISGGMVGVQGGYNWVLDGWLVGVQGDLGVGSIDSSSRCPNPNFECKTELLSILTVRARVGPVINNNFAPYLTAGLASGGIRTSVNGVFGSDEDSQGHGGWTAGVGVVGLLSRNLTWQIEYLRIDLGSQEHSLQGITNKVDATVDLLRAGLHYKFN